MSATFPTSTFAATAPEAFRSENHLPVSVPVRAVNSGIGIAKAQVPFMSSAARPPRSPAWLQATATAPTNETARQAKKAAGEIGIGVLVAIRATNAAQNGVRLRMATITTGCAPLRLTV